MSITPIATVDIDGPGHRAGIQPGERLLAINQHPINDVLDYKFHSYDPKLTLLLETPEGEQRTVTLKKSEGTDLGLSFQTYLMDEAKSCANRCVFCFVDQMPPNLRPTLYFKDDDTRLSLLTGNYVTLTNLTQKEIQRMIDFRVSPINISVHATNPTLRTTLLKHPKAGDCLSIMKRLAEGNITMNCQVVACPGINDGPELARTLEDLAQLTPQVNSISVVPVGITKFRENLPPLESYNQHTAAQVLDLVEGFAKQQTDQDKTALVWCSDEFYLLAKRPLPPLDYYEDLPQQENGVGGIPLLTHTFRLALSMLDQEEVNPVSVTIATGTAAAPFLAQLMTQAEALSLSFQNPFSANVIPIVNDFFGHTIDVAGLVTGGDLIAQLTGKPLGDRVLIPACMLRSGEEVFLDDVTLTQVSQAIGRPVCPIPEDGPDLCDALFGLLEETPPILPPLLSQEAHPYNP